MASKGMVAEPVVAEPMECDSSIPELDPDIAEKCRLSGNEAFVAEDYEVAKTLYTDAIRHNPNCAAYFGNRSATLLQLQDYRGALGDSLMSIRLDENFTKGYLRAAKCHLMMGNPSLSADFYQKVLEKQPQHKQAKQELATTMIVQQTWDRAQEEFDKGEFRTAVFFLDRCLSVAPDCVRFKTQKAEGLALCKRYDDAHSLANDLLRLDRNNADAIYVKALCFYYQDVPEKATQYFTQALRVDPDHRKSRAAIKRSKLLLAKKEEGNEAFRRGKNQLAYETYTEALEIDPLNAFTNAKLFCNRALVGTKLGKLKEAIADCSKAIELDGDYVKAYQRRAKLYQDTDQHDEAVRDLEKMVKLDRTSDSQQALREGKRLLKLSKRKDYYKILSIDRGSTDLEIKKAYKRAAMRHHPDRHVAAEPEEREKEEKIFKEVSEAYSVLSDQRKRMRYDSGQDLEEMGGMDIDPTNLFANLFGGGGGMGFGGRGPTFTFATGGAGGEHFFRF